MPDTANIEARTTRGGKVWLWIILPVSILGYEAFAKLYGFASHFQDGGFVLILGALLAVPILVAVLLGFRQGLVHARSYAPTLHWWHLLWFLTVLGSLVFRQRSASEITSNPLDAWAVYRVAIDMIVFFTLLARLALRRTHWVGSMFRGVVGALTIYGLVCLASTAWSVFPSWTLFKSWEYLLDVAILAAVLETVDSVEEFGNFMNWTWALYGLLLLSIWKDVLIWPKEALYAEASPGASLGIRLSGVMPMLSSNDAATFASVLAVICLARLFPASEKMRFHKPWYVILLLGSLISLILSQTRAAIAGVLLAGLIVLVFSKRGKLSGLVTLVIAPLVAVITMGSVIWTFMERGQTTAQMDTLSSRTGWWSTAWNTFLQRPLTGFGAYAAGRFAVLAQIGQSKTGTMHSDYLETIVGTGAWGMIPILLALFGTWWFLWRATRDEWDPEGRQFAVEGLAMISLITLRSVFNNALTWHPALPFLTVLGLAEFLRRRRKLQFLHNISYLGDLADVQSDPALEHVTD